MDIDKVKIEWTLLDRRRKLTEEQKEEIRELYPIIKSQRKLAKEYNVSRTTIQIIVNPDRARRIKQRIKDHWMDYKDQKSHTKAIRELRRYKRDLVKDGTLQSNG